MIPLTSLHVQRRQWVRIQQLCNCDKHTGSDRLQFNNSKNTLSQQSVANTTHDSEVHAADTCAACSALQHHPMHEVRNCFTACAMDADSTTHVHTGQQTSQQWRCCKVTVIHRAEAASNQPSPSRTLVTLSSHLCLLYICHKMT